jgi:hypothetical protein
VCISFGTIAGIVALWAVAIAMMVWIWRSEGVPFLIFLGVILTLAALMVKFPRLEAVFDAIAARYFRFCFWMIVAFAPPTLAFAAARAIEGSSLLWLQISAFVLWGCLLGIAISALMTEARRARLFHSLRRVGAFAPLAYSFGVLMTAAALFGALTTALVARGYIAVDGDPRRAVDFYMWHFLDAIPVLKINETLLWNAPLTYHQSRVGLLLLIFKIAVIAPVIAAFAGYWAYVETSDRSSVSR